MTLFYLHETQINNNMQNERESQWRDIHPFSLLRSQKIIAKDIKHLTYKNSNSNRVTTIKHPLVVPKLLSTTSIDDI